jgi:hypothetical protein
MQHPLNVKNSLRRFKLGNLIKNHITYFKVSIRLIQPQETSIHLHSKAPPHKS